MPVISKLRIKRHGAGAEKEAFTSSNSLEVLIKGMNKTRIRRSGLPNVHRGTQEE